MQGKVPRRKLVERNVQQRCSCNYHTTSLMSRRILPLPVDHVRDDGIAVAPTQDNLNLNLGILQAEKSLKQKGWRVMAPGFI